MLRKDIAYAVGTFIGKYHDDVRQVMRWTGIALFAMILCVSCSGGDNEELNPASNPSKPAVEDFNQGNMNFTEKVSEQFFFFTANAPWSVTVAATGGGASWCTASPASGNVGTQTVKITAVENDTYDDRSVTVTLQQNTQSKEKRTGEDKT